MWMTVCILVIGIPLLVLVFVCRHRAAISRLRVDAALARWGVLFEAYTPRAFFWYPLLLLRRTLLVAMALISPLRRVQLTGLAMSCTVILVLHVVVEPY